MKVPLAMWASRLPFGKITQVSIRGTAVSSAWLARPPPQGVLQGLVIALVFLTRLPDSPFEFSPLHSVATSGVDNEATEGNGLNHY